LSHQKDHSGTTEDVVPQLSPGYAPPEVDQLDRNPAVPPPHDGLLTPESVSYTSVVMATRTKVAGVEDSAYISRIENLEETTDELRGDIQALMDRVAKLEERLHEQSMASHDDIVLV
jgi:hypothetical protein